MRRRIKRFTETRKVMDQYGRLVDFKYYKSLFCDGREYPLIPEDSLYCWSIHRLNDYGQITESDVHRELGRYFEYSKCCVDNFIELCEEGEMPGQYMNTKYGELNKPTPGYVRCLKCRIMIE